MSIAHYDDVLQIIHELMPPDANLSKDFYQSKKLLEGLGMSYVKIDVCKNNCMLYYKDNEHKEKCDICNTSRYEEGSNKVPRKVLRYLPLKDRLQRLYAHRETAESMLQRRWLCFVIDRTCRGGSRAKQYTLVGSGSPNNDSSQRSQSDGVNSTGPLSQNTDVSTRQPTSRQRGRKRRATTELRVPPHGHRVGLEPEGDRQFKYADPNSKHCKYKMQLGIILKREHPGIIEEKEGDIVIKTRPALQWSDYYDDDTLDDKGQTAADRVKEVFWNLFEVRVKEYEDPYKVEDDADRVLDNYAMKKVRDMMYQLRVDAVKFYFEKQGERLDDTLACSKELEYFKSLRKRGQESRFKSEDVAQNRGGSLPFVEARQILANKYGPEKATTLNTYAAMKCGLKNWDGSRSTSSTLTGKSKKRFDDYSDLARATYPDDWEQRELDGQILYESSGGIPHGRLAIGDGAIKKADVILTAREKKLRPSTSAAHRRTVQENEELNRRNDNLQHKLDMHERLILALFKEMGKELPAELQQGASSQPHGTTNSSHIGPAGEGDLGANGGANNSSGNTSDQAIDATNIRTNNVSAGSGDTSSNNRESET